MTNAANAIQAYIGGSQRSVAKRLGESQQAWWLYLQGERSPTESKLSRWAAAADLDITCTADGWTVKPRSTP